MSYIQINRELTDPLNSNWLFIRPSTGSLRSNTSGSFADNKSQISRLSIASRVSMTPSMNTPEYNIIKDKVEKILVSNASESKPLFKYQNRIEPIEERDDELSAV